MRPNPPGDPRRPRDPQPPSNKLSPRLFGTRVWSAGRLIVLVIALGVTYGTFFLASMRVATRAREVKVPDVRGKSMTDASTALANAGLALRIESPRRPDPTVPADHVLAQDPQPGTVVRRDRAVRLRVSEGQHAPIVPAVTGLSERAAQLTLTEERIQVTSTAEIRTTDYLPGLIVAQDPPAKSRAGAITLLVNRAEAGVSYVMPDLIGTPGARSADVLRKDGFLVAIVGENPYPGLPAGIVIRQTPQAGFQVSFGQPISLEVSR
jgi:beta-lactam-binding protein with PASTA domain